MASIVLEGVTGVVEKAKHVQISAGGVASAAVKIADQLHDIKSKAAGFDKGPVTVQYLLVVDALNFCFWPDGELEYEHLAGGIKASLSKDPSCINADRLACITGAGVRQLVGWHRDLPQQEERARLLREVGCALQQHFQGQAAELVAAAQQSAVRLVQLITAHLPGFRDHAIYDGRQVFFYKRAQIFVADVYGAFGGQSYGHFHDIDQLTMFADYRVPVVLRLLGVLQYSQQLADKVSSGQELPAGSEEELEIRAASIVAVELLKEAANVLLQGRTDEQQDQAQQSGSLSSRTGSSKAAPQLLSVQLDWWLWQEGERVRSEHPHHKTWTIYY